MISFIRPGLLSSSEAEFERDFEQPIKTGHFKDCSPAQKATCLEKEAALHRILNPFVNRKDAKVLAADLPPMQQVVLYVHRTKLQVNMTRAIERAQKKHNKNLFAAYAAQKPILNHPGTLMFRRDRKVPNDDDDSKDYEESVKWWDFIADKYMKQLGGVEQGLKLDLLLHILVLAGLRAEKVVIFSHCLKTLDFIQDVLGRDWLKECPTLSSVLDENSTFKNWEIGRDFLRIDGKSWTNSRRARSVVVK